MKINERLYPHPVLAHFSDDLVGSLFQVTPKVAAGKHSYKFEVIAKTSNRDLRTLVEQSKAQYALHIECAATRYRKIVPSKDEQFSIEVDAEHLDGKVELCSLIIAAADIPEYKNQKFHPEYGGASFAIRKGDVLAVGQDRVFDAVKEVDPLQHISSIFKVRLNKGPEPFTIDIGENILILLSEANFSAYSQLRPDTDRQTTLASMMIIPALVQVLELLKDNLRNGHDEDTDRRWYRVISKKMREIDYSPEEFNNWQEEHSIVIAQKLIGDPLSTSLKIMLDEEDTSD